MATFELNAFHRSVLPGAPHLCRSLNFGRALFACLKLTCAACAHGPSPPLTAAFKGTRCECSFCCGIKSGMFCFVCRLAAQDWELSLQHNCACFTACDHKTEAESECMQGKKIRQIWQHHASASVKLRLEAISRADGRPRALVCCVNSDVPISPIVKPRAAPTLLLWY